MNYRELGKTGLKISEVGYGAWGIGGSMWIGAQDDESLAALNRAFDLGVNFVDTALGYGDGHSEQVVGRAVAARPEEIYVATKVPPKNGLWPAPKGIDPEEAFPADHVRKCVQMSLKNLGTETIDVLQFHVWQDEWIGQGTWLEAVESFKKDGKIRFFGVSINDHQASSAVALVETGLIDSVQVIYNIFDQSPEDELFAACEKAQVGVIARVPYDEGSLTGRITPDTEFPEGDFRNTYFQGDRKKQVYERAQAIASDLDITLEELPELALRFVLSNPAVSTVIPGMRSLRNVDRNCAVADGRGLTAKQLEALRAHRWERNFYGGTVDPEGSL
ncbi:MAG: aldo/keto reductase [Actinobacteria bacterium]|nr:aldo/keto reductase [Actinomycetota bacterium]